MRQFDCLNPKTPLKGHHFLEASAGTGKTFAIEHLTVRLLLQNIPLDQILIVTFTRAATRELKARLRKALSHALNASTLPYMQNLADPLTAHFRLEEALTLIEEAQIFTIHGFCHRMLTEYAYEAKLSFELASEEETTYRDLLKGQIIDFFRTSLTEEAFSPAQLAALFKNEPVKLIKKILSLIEKDGDFPTYPDFTTSYEVFKSALLDCPPITLDDYIEIEPFFNKLRSPIYKNQIQILSQPPTKKGFDALLYHKGNVLTFLTKDNRNKRKQTPLPEKAQVFFELCEKLLPVIDAAKKPLHTLSRIAQACRQEATTLLNFHRVCCPDDILKKMHESLTHPEFLSKVRSRYEAAIIDEFQDTDPLQWSIFKRLFIEKPISTLYLVGDPKQSIYSFRNADIYSYIEAANLIPNKACLGTNYRSDPKLLHLLNQLFSQDPNWLSLFDAPLPYRPVQASNTATDTSFKDEKSPLHFFILEKERTREKSWPTSKIESNTFFPFIAQEIHALVQDNFGFQDIAILIKDRYQASHLKTYLATQNIPVLTKGSDLLIETPLYDFFYALLSAIADPSSSATIKQFLAHPLLPYSHHDLKENSFLTEVKSAINHFAHLFQTYGLERMLAGVLHHPWQGDKTIESFIIEQGSLEAFSDFQKFIELFLEYASQSQPSIDNLLHYLESLKIQDEEHPHLKRRFLTDPNAVTLMTIHMSKGLEFPIVFALGLVKRHTAPIEFIYYKQKWLPFDLDHPTCQSALQNQEAEKLRQLYVAFTRAKKRLYVPAIIDPSQKNLAPNQASPLDLFLEKISPLKQTLEAIGATYTQIEEQILPVPQQPPIPLLKEPKLFTPSISPRELRSFSSLASPTHTSIGPTTTDDTLPKGLETGIHLHFLLESLIRERLTHPYDTEKVHSYIQSSLASTFLAAWTPSIINMVDQAFHLPFTDFFLKDIPSEHLHTEVEFLYSNDSHYTKGFIDLIFFYQNHYYILDWKSNLLPDYSQATLLKTMDDHDYSLQARLYSQALERYLIQKKDLHTFLGTFYVFLRGLSQGQGILFLPKN